MESYVEQLNYLLPLYLFPLPEQMQGMKDYLALIRNNSVWTEEPVAIAVMDLYEAYKKYDMKKIAEISEFINENDSVRYVQNKLLGERNRNWMEKILQAIQEKPAFIAVGTRHLPGKNGLITLLRQEGYTVEAE
jgi:uncharacterized protein YbaP (TraB family)